MKLKIDRRKPRKFDIHICPLGKLYKKLTHKPIPFESEKVYSYLIKKYSKDWVREAWQINDAMMTSQLDLILHYKKIGVELEFYG